MGADARVYLAQIVTALADRPAELVLLCTLLMALGQVEAAGVVARTQARGAPCPVPKP